MKNSKSRVDISLSGISSIARERFGYEQLHAGQPEAIESLLSGHDTLVVMPTGSGKSAIYQIVALLQPGPAIVVSPLIALQQDQVLSINQNLDGNEGKVSKDRKGSETTKAAFINSTLSASMLQQVWDELERGELKFLFLAPEQFQNEDTIRRLKALKPCLFVVDEAHCVSSWGHDFRPDYLRLGRVIEALGHPVTLALTATAAPPVREEIVKELGMREPKMVVQGFDRPNLHLSIECFDEEVTKRSQLIERVLEYRQAGKIPGIVYAATRKETEEVCEELSRRGVKTVCYHAGLKGKEREKAQQSFMDDEAEVMVATVAFGMGIDKPNVRFVFHLDISDSVDSYYQEIGRAGRDGEAAQAILFYLGRDLNLRRFFSSGGRLTEKDVQQVAQALEEMHQKKQQPITIRELRQVSKVSQVKLQLVLRAFESGGVVQILPDGDFMVRRTPTLSQIDKAAKNATEIQERRRHFEKSRIEMMQGYAQTSECLRGYLLNYFGEGFGAETKSGCCTNCDDCQSSEAVREQENWAATSLLRVEEDSHPFALHSRVLHSTLGAGQVMRYEEDKMIVLFDDNGYTTLGVELVTQNHLLEAV